MSFEEKPKFVLTVPQTVVGQVPVQSRQSSPNRHVQFRASISLNEGSQSKNVLHHNPKSFAVKKFRMRSLLWVKPNGVAQTSASSTLAQLIPTLIINVGALSFGLSLGFSSIALPQLRDVPQEGIGSNPFTITEEIGSWIASIFGLGAILGALLSMYLAANFGQRRTVLALAIPDLVGWILIGLAQNVPMILGGRFLTGLASAGYIPAIQAYVTEISQPPHLRWLKGLTVPIIALGTLLSYGIGAALSWSYVAIVGAFLPLILIPSLVSTPDTPYWYMQHGDDRKALQVIEQFRAKDANCLSEMLAIADTLKPTSTDLTLKEAFQVLHQKQNLQPLFVLNFLFFLVVSSGSATITFYTADVLKMVNPRIDIFGTTVLLGAFKLVGACLFIPAVNYNQKRTLLCVSSLIMGFSLAALGMIMKANENKPVGNPFENLEWIPLLCLSLYVIADSAGFSPIPSLYITDFFPAELRPILVGLSSSFSNLKLFIILKWFPDIVHHIGASTTFWIYASFCFLGTIFAFVSIKRPEGKSLHDIEKYFGLEETNTLDNTPANRSKSTPNAPYQKLGHFSL